MSSPLTDALKHKLATIKKGGAPKYHAKNTDEKKKARHLDEARPLCNVDIGRRVLGREMRGPEQEAKPLGHDAEHGENAVGVARIERLKDDERLKAGDVVAFHRRSRGEIDNGNKGLP